MDGILPLWKERGMTSHDCVFKLRKILKTKKIGHGGTLDPDVDGVLPICIGKGTKVIEFLSDSGKVYEGEITLGFETTTEDASGEIVQAVRVEEPFSNEQIDQVMATFLGEIIQIPPMYSAVKVNGKRLYEYARAGETVERPRRKATINCFERLGESVWDEKKGLQSWRFRVECGKGTYVRTLAVDVGKKLGVPAHMSDLTRLASGGFSKEQALTLEQISKLMGEDIIEEYLLPIEEALQGFQRVEITNQLWGKVKNGMRLPYETFGLQKMPTSLLAIYYQGQVVSLYEENPKEPGILKPRKVLRTQLGDK